MRSFGHPHTKGCQVIGGKPVFLRLCRWSGPPASDRFVLLALFGGGQMPSDTELIGARMLVIATMLLSLAPRPSHTRRLPLA